MARTGWRQRLAGAVVGTLAGFLGTVGAQAQPAGTAAQAQPTGSAAAVVHVRGLRNGVYDAARLLADAREASPTVRGLLDALQETDVIVLVEVQDRVLNRTGYLNFMGAAHGTRWLHITLEAGNRPLEQMAWLAHELRHAVEVAGAPEVRDMAGLGRFYARIGTKTGDGRYETDAAVEAGRRALREVYGVEGPSKRR